jgi:3-mercaptopyruvate sulfurtransferase SseA
MLLSRVLSFATLLAAAALPVWADEPAAPAAAPQTQAENQWESFITAAQLHERLNEPDLLIIDVRSAEEYDAAHIPSAINIPGKDWRTPSAKPGAGDSQYIFRTPDGSPDVARYEKLLSQAGVTRDHDIVIYGNHAGKADGSVPAMILHWLGHPRVQFLDGVGMSEWYKAGHHRQAHAPPQHLHRQAHPGLHLATR